MAQNSSNTADREIVLSRVINAPRELVWEAFTNPKHLEKWWGPNGFNTKTKEFDFREGGDWVHTMTGPDGQQYPNHSHFEEIRKPELLRYLHGGGRVDGTYDSQFEATITFEDEDGKKKVTMRSIFPSAAARDYVVREYGAVEGGKQHLANLDEYVTHIPIILEQTYNAPVSVVWKALTDPAQMREWYMPHISDFKPEVGFKTEFTVHHDGKDYPHIWQVTEVEKKKKISYEWLFGGNPGHSVVTFELTPVGVKTKLVFTHTGIESFRGDINVGLKRENFMEGWTQLVHQLLKNFVEKA